MLGWRLIPSLAGLNAKPAVNGEGHDRGSHSKGQDVGDALFHGSVVSGAVPRPLIIPDLARCVQW